MTTTRLADSLASREERHRRWILLGVASLLVASTTPVFGHHVVKSLDGWPTIEHFGRLCFRAIEALFAPVHEGFHVIILAGVAYATLDRWRAVRNLRQVVIGVGGRAPKRGSVLWLAARRAGLPVSRMRVIEALPNPAFTAGLVRPRVYVAAELAERLGFEQLVALLVHERAHLDRRDPLRLFILRALACTLFWLPALRRLADDLADEAEVLADDMAAAHAGTLTLASAILALASWPAIRLPGTAGFAHGDLLDRRVRRLVGEQPPVGTHVTWKSLVGATLALALVWSSGAIALHGRVLDETAGHAHCQHERTSPFAHLFCLGSSHASERPCPHGAG